MLKILTINQEIKKMIEVLIVFELVFLTYSFIND